jgi:UDP-GlcNAc:undecaprenyl-phosphate GlcNAc-1-phosphate transferase
VREYFLTFLAAAAVTYLLTPLVRRLAVAFHAMPEPRDRDVHLTATPRLGGLAMFGGLCAGLLVADQFGYLSQVLVGSRTTVGLLLAGGLVVVMGAVDDRWGMGAISKLAGQVAAGGILVWSGVELSWIPSPYGNVIVLSPNQGLVLTILVVVVTINAVNFIDGLDGLAAGIVCIAALAYFSYCYTLLKVAGDTTQSLPALVSAILAGLCIGFLPHNFHPARIFMGDTGSMLLGLLLAYGPISSTATLDPSVLIKTHAVNRFPTILPILLPAAIFLIPYADLLLAVARRTRAGQSLFAADKKHLHHRLLNIGHSQRKSVLIMYLWAALFAVAVVSLSVVRTKLIVLVVATVAGMLILLLVSVPRLRPHLPSHSAPPAPPFPPTARDYTPSARDYTPPAPDFPSPAPDFPSPAPGFPPSARDFDSPAPDFAPRVSPDAPFAAHPDPAPSSAAPPASFRPTPPASVPPAAVSPGPFPQQAASPSTSFRPTPPGHVPSDPANATAPAQTPSPPAETPPTSAQANPLHLT